MEAGAAPRMSQAEMKLVGLTAMIMTITVCSDDNTGPDVGPPAQLLIVSSNEQEDVVGSDLGEPLMVRTLDADDNPVPDVDVSWSVTGGGGSLSHDRSVTDESGEATTEWTLGTEPGENAVRAEIEGLDAVRFTATALVGSPGELEIVGGDGQEGMAESVLNDSLVVRVQDGFGNPVPDVEVVWQVTEGDGSLSPETSSTNESGEASTEWTTGSPGAQEASAHVEGLTQVTFTAVAEAEEEPEPEPAEIQIVSGNNQAAEVGTTLPDPLIVEVLDAEGTPLPDIEVTWAVQSGAGSVDPETSVTDDSGETSAEWTLGDEPGELEATASVEGLDPVVFTATAESEEEPEPEPADVRIVSGNNQAAEVGATLPDPLIVEVLDADGTPLPDIEVTWAVPSGAGSVDPESSATNDSGRARTGWTLGDEPGELAATATVEGLDPVTFAATAEPEPEPEPSEIQIVSGNNQAAEVGTTLPDPLIVEVLDADGTPLPGIEVMWAVQSGAGSVDPETSVTNDSGRARTEWTLGDEPGELEATATVEGLDPVTLTATAEPEPEPEPSEIHIVSGNNQDAEVGTTLPDPLIVEVRDAEGTPLPDIEVTWAVQSGAGSVDPASSVTNDSGRARTEWTLGDEPGELEATATVEGLEPVTFTATAERVQPGPPANIEIVTGAPDSTVIDQALADSLAVRITDADGLPVPDVEVSWEVDSWSELVPAGLSSISPAASFTDSDGIARAEWTIGTDPHIYFAEASAEAGLSETFETLAYLPPGSTLEAASQTDQTISVGESGDSVVIRLTDGQGNPLSDVVIDWDYNKAPSLEHIAGHRTTALSPIRRRLTMQRPDAQRIIERRAVGAMTLALVPTDENGEAAFVPGPFAEPGEYVIGARLEGNDAGLVARQIEFTVTVEP